MAIALPMPEPAPRHQDGFTFEVHKPALQSHGRLFGVHQVVDVGISA